MLNLSNQFHFEDISEHTEKLRNKVLYLENTVRTSPGKTIVSKICHMSIIACLSRLDCTRLT